MIELKKIKLIVIGSVCLILFGASVYAQQADRNLHLPEEFDKVGQMVYGSLEYTFSRMSEYVNANDVVTKEGMDSVTRVATLDFIATLDSTSHHIVADLLSGKQHQQDLPDNPQLKAKRNDMIDAIKKSYGDLDQLATQLCLINRMADANLSEEYAVVIYATTCKTYYSAKYWSDNMEKWQNLRENAKKKVKK
jgi:hypothetical protein